MRELEKLYHKETGKSAWESWGPPLLTNNEGGETPGHLQIYVEAPTVEYVQWVEKLAMKKTAHNKAHSEICFKDEGCRDAATLKFYKTKWSFCPHCGRKIN